jgi:hypothetical protein
MAGAVASIEGILGEQFGNHGRVEVGAHTRNNSVLEINHPAVAVVEAHAILGSRQRMQLNHGLITFRDHMLHMQLRALRKNPAQLGEGARNECLFAGIVTRERVRAHHGPIDVIGYMLEEGSAVAILQSSENLAYLAEWDAHVVFPRSG